MEFPSRVGEELSFSSRAQSVAATAFLSVIARAGRKRGGLRDGRNEPQKCHGENSNERRAVRPWGAMDLYLLCHREERSDVAIQLFTAFRGSQSAGILRDDKHGSLAGAPRRGHPA